MEIRTELAIIGAGAAGLMAACAAAEAGLDCLVVERRHRPGLKMLLCGNNRCNISHQGTPESMIAAYGEPVGTFLEPAVRYFPPARLRSWFEGHKLPLTQIKDRIYPRSEKADDVLHLFTDFLRDREVPMLFNCPVSNIRALDGGSFRLECPHLVITARQVIMAVGGASYPKTGSVGDGQILAPALGHKVEPQRAGLVGVETSTGWLIINEPKLERNLQSVTLTVKSVSGEKLAAFGGNLLADGTCLRGSAAFDAMRFLARRNLALTDCSFTLDVFPDSSAGEIAARIQKNSSLYHALNSLGLECNMAEKLADSLNGAGDASVIAARLKKLPLELTEIHPLKEAIVTVGGVSLDEIDSQTMQSRLVSGLYFAGEVMDIDGPTGGFNLHAAFATARLAINGICRQNGRERFAGNQSEGRAGGLQPKNARRKPEAAGGGSENQAEKHERQPRPMREHSPKSPKSAWGQDFWKKYMR